MLKNAYDFLRSKGFLELDYPTEKDTEKVNLSYGCDDIVDELRQEVMLYDWDTPTRLFYRKRKQDKLLIFVEYALPEDTYDTGDDYIILGLMDCLRVMVLQNDIFDRTLAQIDKDNGY